jgi:hypothetical protein
MTGIGPVVVRQPRVRDRGAGAKDAGRIRFMPAILPPYARRSRSLEVLIPILYLKGISTGDFEEALAALLGKDAPGLSPSTIARLKETWIEEHARWKKRALSARRYVYEPLMRRALGSSATAFSGGENQSKFFAHALELFGERTLAQRFEVGVDLSRALRKLPLGKQRPLPLYLPIDWLALQAGAIPIGPNLEAGAEASQIGFQLGAQRTQLFRLFFRPQRQR